MIIRSHPLSHYLISSILKHTRFLALYVFFSLFVSWAFDGGSSFFSSNMPYVRSDPSDKDAEPFVEIDSTGRYGRYGDLLGAGAVKKVYRAFDQEEGREVAWNQVSLIRFLDDKAMLDRIRKEVFLLRTLKDDNIITSFSSWIDQEDKTLNFTTEFCTSGNLRDYRRKHPHVSDMALKKWSRQILRGLEYLHLHEPCIIHRDLNCSNVFINGNNGKVKIGDLGLAATTGKDHMGHSILGTPEFMAPEIYDENYTEKVDIYSFGMCVLELATMEIPYSECDSVAKIYKKVTSGVKPRAMNKVRDLDMKVFIEKCLAPQTERPSASELLEDPIFAGIDDEEN
ncbi:hypothetical protein I3842_09G102200 [Carya illinoinensis]|uniref:non-specific serine/threonine protein kinase n=1 Tax=Carya illinoinensis TaxID=32201 RepID=A0A922E5D9_CARIL|nr:hypothetical protein I3842_09G102200 [Carya illinoinensis]